MRLCHIYIKLRPADDDDADADKDGNGNTAKNTVISPNFLVCKFCGKAQFLHSFGRIARNYAETVPEKLFRSESELLECLLEYFFHSPMKETF